MRATVKFQLRQSYVSKEGKQSLALRYLVNRKSTYFGLGISINPKHWDKNASMVRKGDPMAYYFNKIICDIEQKAKALIMDNYYNPLPVETFQNLLFEKKDNHTDFYEFVEQELEVLKVDRKGGTIANYKKLINTMKLWKPTLAFSEITLDFVEKFHAHEIEQGNLESTVHKKHANFKFLIGRAVLKKKITENPYTRFAIKKCIDSQNNDVLEESQLDKLYATFERGDYKGNQQEVLRYSLFSAYTGLSYADVEAVTYGQLKKYTVDGHEYPLLAGKRVKTGEDYSIPIVSPKVQKLLGAGLDFQKIFASLSNDKTNKHLKKILKEQGVKERITFHRLRHTFITIASTKGLRKEHIKLIVGHSGGDITDGYIHLQNKTLIVEMLANWIA